MLDSFADVSTRDQARAQEAASRPDITQMVSTLPQPLQELIEYIYSEATSALTSAVAANITAKCARCLL